MGSLYLWVNPFLGDTPVIFPGVIYIYIFNIISKSKIGLSREGGGGEGVRDLSRTKPLEPSNCLSSKKAARESERFRLFHPVSCEPDWPRGSCDR